MVTKEELLIDLLHAKYNEDPKGFSDYLPGAAELMREEPTRRNSWNHAGLTEQELSHHRAGLTEALDKLDEDTITADEAVIGLRHCAALIRDSNLHYGWDRNLSTRWDTRC